MTAIPAPPALGFSFTSFSTNNPTGQQPGASLDAEYNRIYAALAALIAAVSVSLNADGTLNSGAVETAYQAQAGGAQAGGQNIADAPSALSAQLSQAWAEYMPDTIPADTLASTGITGDHYSARWWANEAATLVTSCDQQISAFTNALQDEINQATANTNAALQAYENSVSGQIAAGTVNVFTSGTPVLLVSFDTNPNTGASGWINGTRHIFNLVRSDNGQIATPVRPEELLIVVGGVIQQPGVDFVLPTGNTTVNIPTPPTTAAHTWAVWMAPGQATTGNVPPVLDGGSF